MTSGTRITVDGRSQWNDSVAAVLGIVVPPTAVDAPLHADLSAHSVGDIRLIDITTSRMSAITSAPPVTAPPRYWFGVQLAGSCRLVRGSRSSNWREVTRSSTPRTSPASSR
ncbi:hypothetical protein [Geodermatophilus sp. URMC 62]|uniref:hypothetical protein n=1 Tax=Geodermatophilus sp. URMC 62 TaxID=3423414 RepID=UPI00406C8CE9